MLQTRKKFWGKRPGFDFGDVIHVGVNLAFVVVLFLMVRYWNLAILAAVLVILSKWRVLAVQPRFWLPNIKANLVDIIVGLSTVMLIYQSLSDRWAIAWAVLYGVWLLYLKPRTSDLAVGVQALWALLIGLSTVFVTTGLLDYSFVGILAVWVIAWAVARHFLGNYEEPHYKTLSLVWAFLVTQLAWIGFHWVSYYRISSLRVSNVALLAVVLAGTLGSIYHSYRSEKLHKSTVVENLVFGGALLAIILATSSWRVVL